MGEDVNKVLLLDLYPKRIYLLTNVKKTVIITRKINNTHEKQSVQNLELSMILFGISTYLSLVYYR